KHATGANAHRALDDDERTDLNVLAQFGLGGDDRAGMDASGLRDGHVGTRLRERVNTREGQAAQAAAAPQSAAPGPSRGPSIRLLAFALQSSLPAIGVLVNGENCGPATIPRVAAGTGGAAPL